MYRRRRRFLQRPAPGVRPAPRAASSITGLLERISVIAHISSQQEYKERERIERMRSKRLFFNGLSSTLQNFSKSLSTNLFLVLLETVPVKSVRACVCVARYKDRGNPPFFPSLLVNSPMKRRIKSARKMCSSSSVFALSSFFALF